MSTPSNVSSLISQPTQGDTTVAEHALRDLRRLLSSERGLIYRWLSFAFQDPARDNGDPLRNPGIQAACSDAATTLRKSLLPNGGEPAHGEVPSEWLDLEHSLTLLPEDNKTLIAKYDELFGLLLSRDCPPYETEYCPQTFSVYRSNQLADIAGFYSAFGVEPSRTSPERADHIVLELEFMSWLILKETRASEISGEDSANAQVCREAQQRFLTDHLLWWAPALGFAIRKKADHITVESELVTPPKSFYGATAQLLAAFVRAERLLFGIHPPQRLLTPNPIDEPDSMSCGECELQMRSELTQSNEACQQTKR